MNFSAIKRKVADDTGEAARLHKRVHETFRRRNETPEKTREWLQSCEEFQTRYNSLAFPGGYAGALDRIRNGEANAMEAAICFLELRPYFFHSGFMFKDILRACRKAPLSEDQSMRFALILRNVEAWRDKKQLARVALHTLIELAAKDKM